MFTEIGFQLVYTAIDELFPVEKLTMITSSAEGVKTKQTMTKQCLDYFHNIFLLS